MTRPAKATSAKSLRKALNVGSGGFDGPESAKSSALVGVRRRLADDWPVSRGAVALAEVALEPFKKFCPAACADNEHVTPVVLVPLPAQIAERAERIQGASHDRFGNADDSREAAQGVRAGVQINAHQQRHLTSREVRPP